MTEAKNTKAGREGREGEGGGKSSIRGQLVREGNSAGRALREAMARDIKAAMRGIW